MSGAIYSDMPTRLNKSAKSPLPNVEKEIWIVLAAYNAGALIVSQIESIIAQTYPRWRLLIRDDGSTDDTREHITQWAERDARIDFLSDHQGRLGTVANFSLLLETALQRGASWVALADQDDVWISTKLAQQVARLDDVSLSLDHPVLVHSDLEVVGPNLEPYAPSLLQLQGLRHEEDALPVLLIQNFVTGCTCLANRALLEQALPIPGEAVMHDWWLALYAAATGTLGFEPQATVRYRQHDASQIGAKPYWHSLTALLARTLRVLRPTHTALLATLQQVHALEIRLSERQAMGGDTESIEQALAVVSQYLTLHTPGTSRLARVRGLRRLGVRRQDQLRTISFLLKLLMVPLSFRPQHCENLDPSTETKHNSG